MKKRITSLLMALVLALSLVPATVWAADDPIPVGTFEQLQEAIASEADTIDIVVTDDIELTQQLTISGSKKDITIRSQEGGTYKLLRSASFQPNANDYNSEYVFQLKYGKLTFQNIILDGNKEAVTAKNAFVTVSGSNAAQLTLGQGATIQNCASTGYSGAVYVSQGTLIMEAGSAIKDCSTVNNRGGAIAVIYDPYWSGDSGAITFTMKGATISGCATTGANTGYGQGGAIYAHGRVTMDIQDSTIENNTAIGNGGAIYAESSGSNSGDITLNISGTTITGNTSEKTGGGVYFAGKTFTVSGVTDITGNTGSGGTNNVYLTAKKTVDASGLAEGSKIGISGATIPSTLITGYADDSENGYFTSDRTETKLTATTDGGLLIEGKDEHTHCTCGRTDCQETGNAHRKITCKGVSSLDLITGSGSYYLLNDVTLTKTWEPPTGVTLCLNGHAIHAAWKTAAINLKSQYGFRFDLTDCGTDGKVTGNINSSGGVDEASGVIIGERATFYFYNGSICDNTLYTSGTTLKAGAVEVNGKFFMYGGSIKNNQGTVFLSASSNNIGGVLVSSTGEFFFMGGEISGNSSTNSRRTGGTYHGGAVYVDGGYFKMTGGVMKGNTAGRYTVDGSGGAVYITNNGEFIMTGGEISGNNASHNGGGVAVVNGTFEMSGKAKISGNTTLASHYDMERKGGGVFVGEKGTFTMTEDTSIVENVAGGGSYSDGTVQGGGVYVSKGGTFTMSDNATIKSNSLNKYNNSSTGLRGGGVFVAGTLNLNGGSIEENTAYDEGGGIYLDTDGVVNLGTGKITVQNNTSEKTTGHNLYLPGEKKLIAEKAPKEGSNITISLPLERIQKAEGSVFITNTGKDIQDGDKRFSFEAEKITLVRSGDDLLSNIPPHTHDDGTTYIPVYSLADIPANTTGNYYLLQDGKMSSAVTIGADNKVNICLNGHKSEGIFFTNNGTLNITDCKHDTATPGYITGYARTYNLNNASGSTLNLTNVIVKEKSGGTFIYAEGATVNISDCDYSDNKSGFLLGEASKVAITDSTFKNNTMNLPVIWVTDSGDTTSDLGLTVKNCTLTGNTNNYSNVNYENSRGCAINSGSPGTTLIENCIVTGNTTSGDGGGIYLYGKGKATIRDCTVENNEAKWHGGGIAVENSTNAPVFTGKVVVKDNKSKIPYNAYYQDMETVVDCNVYLRSGTITTDSGFKTTSSIGLSAWDVPALVVSGNTSTKGFFADDKDFVLRPTTSKTGPLLTSGNTGLELWYNGTGHSHCVCGTGTNTADSEHTHEKVNWIGVTELKNLPEGNYFLLRGYNDAWAPTTNINLCLNGLGISSGAGENAIIDVDDGNKVAVTDCNESKPGTISGSGWYSRDVYVSSSSTFTLWNGKLSGYDTTLSSSYNILNGGGVWMDSGKFIMNGGSISARSTSGHGGVVYMYGGTFIMNGGSLSGKALNGSGGAVYNKYGNFTMNGGTITGQVADTAKDNGSRGVSGYGGAVYGEYATININGGTITGSSAAEGSGILAKKSTITIGKANITDNTAAHGGGGIYAFECALTIDGATITGNNGGESLGGGVYISGAKGKGTTSDPYIPAVIKNATIQNNTAKCAGGINASGPVKISDTTITGNTATTLEKWGGGGVNARIIPESRNSNGWVFELSGKVIITGNKAEGVDNNLYFPEVGVETMLPAVKNLAEGSAIGVSTEVKPLNNGVISPVYITSDAGNLDYFTSDEGYVVKLDTDKNQLYLIAESSTVTVTLGENMTVSSGDLKQTVLKNHPIADVTITAADGYYFPEDYAASLAKDGVTVTRDSLTQITVSGTPTADEVALTLPAATAKTTPAAPSGLQGVAPSSWGKVDGKISGTKATMEWSVDGKTWTGCTDGTTTVGGEGDYLVRVKATDISYVSNATTVTVPKYLKAISFPAPTLSYNYTGKEHTLLVSGEGYTVEGTTKATDAGNYTATVKLEEDKYQWSSTPASNTISWTISKRAAQAEDFAFTAPTDLVWDGNPKTANISLNTPYTLGGCTTSLVYKQNGQVVESPTDPGTYQVYLVITGDGNFQATDGLTADSWKFEILHPADHIYGAWEHNDTQHWHNCTVPGCSAEERGNHTTDTPATCVTRAVCTTCQNQYGEFNTHNHTEGKVTSTDYKAPTCGSKGNEAYSYCTDCQKYFKDGDSKLYDDASAFDIEPLTHKNATKTNAVAATCEVGGNEAYWFCADCGNYYADKDGKLDPIVAYNSNARFLLSALGHDYEGQPYKTSATEHWQICKHDGCTQESKHEAHNGNEATCVAESKCQACGYKLADKDPNNHLGAERTEAKDPNCTEPGNAPYWHCGDCGKYFADNDGQIYTSKAYETNESFLENPLGHIFKKAIIDAAHLAKKATCTEAPAYYYSCVRCEVMGDKDTFSVGGPLGHDFTKEVVDENHLKTAATCTESAVYYYGCSRCDEHSTTDTFTSGDPLGHEYTRQVVDDEHLVNPATCTKAAEYVYTCARCDDHNTTKTFESGKPLGHDFTEEVVDDAHLKAGATCTKAAEYYYDCSRCDEHSTDKTFTDGKPLGHDFTEEVVDENHLKTAATCTEAAVYYYDCSRCDEHSTDKTFTDGKPLGHDFNEEILDAAHLRFAATCTEPAVYYYDCTRCDEISIGEVFESGKPLGHDFTEKLVDDAHLKTAATCTESAVYYYDCSRCDEHSADKTFTHGDPLGHSYTKEDTGAAHLKTAATCTEDAVYFKSCERCGKNGTETFTAENTALGHSYTKEDTGAEHLKSAATCTEDAVYFKSCERCGVNGTDADIFTVAGTALGHDFAGQPYLHDENGHWQTCKRDGCEVTSTAQEHTSDEGKITKEPTAAVEGEKTFTCTVCGEVLRTEPVAKIAPTIVEGANGKHQSGDKTGLTFKSDAAREDFLSVSVDGKVLDESQYTIAEDGVTVTLLSSYLSTLSVGQHTLGVTSASGTASTVFTVTAAPAVVPTGDSASMALWLSLAALCGLGTLVVVSRKKRENG